MISHASVSCIHSRSPLRKLLLNPYLGVVREFCVGKLCVLWLNASSVFDWLQGETTAKWGWREVYPWLSRCQVPSIKPWTPSSWGCIWSAASAVETHLSVPERRKAITEVFVYYYCVNLFPHQFEPIHTGGILHLRPFSRSLTIPKLPNPTNE